MLGPIVMLVAIMLIILLIPYIIFLVSLQNTIKLIAPENRRLSPGTVWIMLIPVVGGIWGIVMVKYVADSIAKELRSKGEVVQDNPTYAVGLAMCITQVLSIVPGMSAFLGLPWLVLWIIYWVQIAKYKEHLQRAQHKPAVGATTTTPTSAGAPPDAVL